MAGIGGKGCDSFIYQFFFSCKVSISGNTRKCNTVENIHIHKVIGPWDRVILVRDRGNHKESGACPITKASNSSHFHITLSSCSLLFQPWSIRYFVSIPYLKKKIQRRVTVLQGQQHVSPAQQSWALFSVSIWMGDRKRIPSVVITFFFFLSPSFSKVILRTAELPSLCNVASSIHLFIPGRTGGYAPGSSAAHENQA